MSSILHNEWLNANSNRAYPFKEDCGRMPVDASGNFISNISIPNFLIVDFVFTFPSEEVCDLYLAQLINAGSLLTFVIKQVTTNETVSILTINKQTHNVNKSYFLKGTGKYEDANGKIVLGDLSRLDEYLPQGIYTFTFDQTQFESSTVRPSLRGVRSLRVINGSEISSKIFGDVQLVAGENIRLEYDQDNNAIWIHAEPNAGYVKTNDCEDLSKNEPVETINGVPIKDVNIVGDGESVEVTVDGNNIIISNPTAEPCCGCPELEFLTQSAKILEASLSKLESYADQLRERIDHFVNSFVLTVRP